MLFSKRFEAALDRAEKKQIDLNRDLEIASGVTSGWKKRESIGKKYLKEVADYLDVDTDYLLGTQDEFRRIGTNIKYIPLIGIASCGVPNQTYDDIIEYIPVPDKLARDGVYAVTADGDSMLPKISHGDIVICDKETPCENGNIVHYTTNDGESGLKKFMLKDGIVTLYPLNTDGFTPIIIKEDKLRCARAIKIISDL